MTFLRKSLTTLAGAMALSAVFAAPVAADVKTVMVTAIVEHPALDAVRKGTHDELAEQGFVEGKNLKWEFQSAQGNAGTAGQIARKFVGANPDVIVAIATPSAQPVVAATKSIPIVYSAIADPMAAQLVKSWAPSGTNVTGASNMLDPVRQADMIQKIVPKVKKVGIVYNPGEANSVSALNNLKGVLSKRGVEIISVAAPRTVDIAPAAKSLIDKVDVMYTTTDNNVMAAYEAIAKVCNDAGVPLISSDPGGAPRGAVVAMGIDFYALGRDTGKMVARILKGEKPGSIPSAPGQVLDLQVNLAAAKKQGVTVPEDIIKSASKVIR